MSPPLAETVPDPHHALQAVDLSGLMLRDRHRLTRRLQALRPDADSAERQRVLDPIARSVAEAERRASIRPVPTFDADLPVIAHRREIADAVVAHPVVILCGETGSGKTTQLPKICLDLGRGVRGTIGHTQPRRIAARAVAARLRDELGRPETVGYKVRFADETGPDTFVKLMTDGILLAEIQQDRFLEQYDTIILDEAHERSLNIDFLLGYLKTLLPRRPDLKLIVTSATIDPDRFSRHFDGAPVITVGGRTYPVEVRYRPLASDDDEGRSVETVDAIVAAVEEVGRDPVGGFGDTLVFLPGEREIRETADALDKAAGGRLDLLRLYARLGTGDQNAVFARNPSGKRRVVLATNVAETSLTVPNITAVVDTGLARISRYSPRQRLQRLPIEPVSQASADQRAGRCGRVAPGLCVRLFSEDDYTARPAFTDPEILRTNLAAVILQMKAYRLGEIEDFGFVDRPDYRQVRDGFATLFEIGAIDSANRLTDVGRLLARMPTDPRVGRMILAARDENCLRELLVIAAALSTQDPRDRPIDKRHDADQAHATFREAGSDFLSLVNLWTFWETTIRPLGRNAQKRRAREAFLSHVRLREWADVYRQLRQIVVDLGWPINTEPAPFDAVHRALLSGLLTHVGTRSPDSPEYTGVRGRKFHLFPGSGLFHKRPKWVVAAELVETTKVYARTVGEVRPEWVERVAGDLLKRTYADPHWQRKTARVMAYETVTLYGLPVFHKRPVPYARVDPRTCRSIFLRSALVEGDYDTDAPFFRHNERLVRDVQLLEAKTRRRDILADADTRFAFYDARIPAHVVGGQSFDQWRRQAEHDQPRLLWMTEADLLGRPVDRLGTGDFPDTLIDWEDAAAVRDETGRKPPADHGLPLSYRFDPGHPDDGVTVTIPLALLNRVSADRVDWLVPGLLAEKCLDLLRALPKPIRVKLVPAPDYVQKALARMTPGPRPLLPALADALGRVSGVHVPADAFDPSALVDYLRMNVQVVDEQGKTVAAGRDVRAIRDRLRTEASAAFRLRPPPPWDRDGVVAWDFPDLPERIETSFDGRTVQGFPSLIDTGDGVSLRLLDSPDDAVRQTRRGVRRLFLIDYAKELRHLINTLPAIAPASTHYATLLARHRDAGVSTNGTPGERLREQIRDAVADRLVADIPKRVRTREEFTMRLETAWNRLRPLAESVGDLAARTLAESHELAIMLDRPVPDLLRDAFVDVNDQLDGLLPPDVLVATPADVLPHLPRYVKAARLRVSKLLDAGYKRDFAAAEALRPVRMAYRDRVSSDAAFAVSPRGRQIRWLIEELRVQLFAQDLGTAVPVSVKRLTALLNDTTG